MMVEEQYLYAVVSLPSGVFNPYSGVKTSILFFDRNLAKISKDILFIKVENDGFDLGAQRREINENDLPKSIEVLKEYQQCLLSGQPFDDKKYSKSLLVSKDKISQDGDYNLTAARYEQTIDHSNCQYEMVKLGDVCNTTSGGTPLKSKTEYYVPNEIPWINSGELKVRNIKKAEKYISQEGLKNSSAKLIPAKSVLVAMYGATAGQVSILDFEATTNQAICSILPNNKVDPTYLYYILSSQTERLVNMSVGGAQPNISQNIIKNIELPLPPLDIQEEIVKELDQYQAIIDGAQKIIDNWEPSFPINSNWEKVKLGDLYEISYGVTVAIPDNLDENGIKIISTAETTLDGYLDFSKIRKVKMLEKYKSHILQPDTLLFNWRNAPKHIGKTVLFTETDEPYICASFLLPMKKLDTNRIINQWGWLEINRLRREGYFIKHSRQAVNQTNFNSSLLAETYINLPSIEEQKAIVEKIEKEEQYIDACKSLVEFNKQKIADKIKSIWNCNNE